MGHLSLTALREIADQERNFEVKIEHKSERERSISIYPAITSFSDNVLISFDLDKAKHGGAFHGLMVIRNMACALAHRAREFGCLVRGAVTVGELYQEDRVAFGTGLVAAYELESTVAFFPRVIVTPSVFELFPAVASADGQSTDDRALFRDTDGYWCLDYMTAYLEYLGSAINPDSCAVRRTWALGARAKYRETAATLADAGKQRAAQKWAWFGAGSTASMAHLSCVVACVPEREHVHPISIPARIFRAPLRALRQVSKPLRLDRATIKTSSNPVRLKACN